MPDYEEPASKLARLVQAARPKSVKDTLVAFVCGGALFVLVAAMSKLVLTSLGTGVPFWAFID